MDDAVLSFSVPLRARFLDDEGPDAFELHIPARLLLNHDLAPPGTRTAVTAPEVPLHMWGDKVCVNSRTQWPLNGPPESFAGRSVVFKTPGSRSVHIRPLPQYPPSRLTPPAQCLTSLLSWCVRNLPRSTFL